MKARTRLFLRALEDRCVPATWTVDVNNGTITGDDGGATTVNSVPFTTGLTDSGTVKEFRIRGNLSVPVNTIVNFTNNPSNFGVRFFAGNDITIGAGSVFNAQGVGAVAGPGGGAGGPGGVSIAGPAGGAGGDGGIGGNSCTGGFGGVGGDSGPINADPGIDGSDGFTGQNGKTGLAGKDGVAGTAGNASSAGGSGIGNPGSGGVSVAGGKGGAAGLGNVSPGAAGTIGAGGLGGAGGNRGLAHFGGF